MSEKSMIVDFTQGSAPKQLVVFAVPLLLSNLLQIVYNMVDMVIVGQVLGKVGLSAVSVGGDMTTFLTYLAIGFSNAGQVIIAQYIGAGERKRIGRFVGTMFTFLLSFALVLSVVCLVLRHQILGWMNTPAEALSEAGAYATVCIVGLFFIYGYNAISAVLRGMGDSKRPFFFISIAAVTNIVLDLLFVLVLDMGSMGAALATVMSQGLSFVLCALFIYRHRAQYELTVENGRFFGIDGEMLASLIKLGFPMALKSASVNFSKLFVNSWLNSYGVAVSAFAGIASKINSISNLVSNAFSTAGSSMIGQNISAGKYERVKKVMGSVFFMTTISALLFSAAFLLFPQQIYSIFISGEDAEVMAIGMRFLPIAILIFFGSTARSGMNALINGSGNHVVNFIAAILDGIVLRIGLSVLFGLGFGMKEMGFWLGDALAGFTPFWIGLALYMSGKWKKKAVR